METNSGTQLLKRDNYKVVALSYKNLDFINEDNLTKEEKSKIEGIVANIQIEDSQTISQYGITAQQKIADFSDNILDEIKNKDLGELGESLINLTHTINELNPSQFKTNTSFLEKIPILKNITNNIKRTMIKYNKVSNNIENIILMLDKTRISLIKDTLVLDSLYNKNIEYLRELDIYIMAGKIKIDEMGNMLSGIKKNKDIIQTQKFNDNTNFVNRFEKKIYDLLLSRMVAIQSLPQIRLIQNNNQLLVEKIQSSILNVVPLWKNQIIVYINLIKQKKALKLQQEISKTTNDLLLQNSTLIKNNTIETAKEAEKGIIEIETLKKTSKDLIETITETMKIYKESKEKRKQSEIELSNMENEFKNKLLELKNE